MKFQSRIQFLVNKRNVNFGERFRRHLIFFKSTFWLAIKTCIGQKLKFWSKIEI